MSTPTPKFALVPLDMIDVGPNVRTDPTDIDHLAESVAQHGVLEPVLLCPAAKNRERFELLVGQRRFLAARKARLDVIPSLLRPRPSKRDRLIIQMVENYDRAPMSPIEEAYAFAALRGENVTQAQTAELTSRSVSYIHHRLLLLELPEVIQAAVHAKWISPQTALELPEALLEDDQALDELEQTLRTGDAAVRSWVAARARVAAAPRARQLTMYQQFNARIPTTLIPRIKAAAKAEGMTLHPWIEKVLDAAASEVLDGEAVPA